MTSYETIKATVDFANPIHVGCSFPDPYPNDFTWAGYDLKITDPNYEWHKVSDTRWERCDEWGNLWARVDDSSKGEVVKGALDSLDNLSKLRLPDLDESMFERVREKIKENANSKFVISGLPGFTFNIARKIRKLDYYMMDLVVNRKQIETLHDMLDEWLLTVIEYYGRANAMAIMFPEDWGTQLALMISPEMWREIFKPRFERLCDAAHARGMYVFMHSCGKITEIIPDLNEVGVDLLQFDQPTLHGFETLASFQEHGKITYWCPVDIQTTLQTKDESKIENDVKHMLETMWKQRGGFVAGYYGDNKSIGLDPSVQAKACEFFLKYGSRS